MKKNIVTFVLVLSNLFSYAQSTSVVDIIVNSEDHSLFEAAVVEAGLFEALSDASGTFTVLAPTDAAFTILAEELEVPVEQLLELPNLTDILLYHVLPEVVLEEVLLQSGINSMYVNLLPESPIYFQSTATSIAVNGIASVIVADLIADNGVVHVIDRVVIPTPYNDGDDPWNSDEVFIICNGEEIVIDTLDLINNPEEFYEYIASLDCVEFYEDTVVVDSEPESYFSWDCISNYPQASELYGDFGNPEASAELEEFCLAVANGDWMWGEDPSEWPITCEEGTSIATIEFETAGFGYEEEISWSLEDYEGGVGLTPVCLQDGCSQFNMFDSWGDGWGGITFTINSPSGVLLTGTLDAGFSQSLPFGINTSELCLEVTEVDNPDAFTCFEDVFPGIGEMDFNLMFPNIEMTNEDLLFIIEASDIDFSVFDEFGMSYTPQEIDGYLIFGPLSIDDFITFLVDYGILGDQELDWGFFRPMSDEIISQGTFSQDDNSLPNLFSLQFLEINEDILRDIEIYNTYYIDLLGRPIDKIANSGFALKIQQTNQGILIEKVYIKN